MNGRKTRGRAVPKSDQVLVALRLLWISGWAWTTCCSNERNVLCTMLFGAYRFLSGWCSPSSLLAAGLYVKPQQVSLVNHRPFISFALEVAVENLLHQRSVLATAVQQIREEGGTRKKTGGRTKKRESRTGGGWKRLGADWRKAKTEERKRCWWNNPSTPPSSFASSRFQEQTKKEKRERDREREDWQTRNQEGEDIVRPELTGRHLRLYLDPAAAPAPTALPYGEHLAVHHWSSYLISEQQGHEGENQSKENQWK